MPADPEPAIAGGEPDTEEEGEPKVPPPEALPVRDS